MKYTQQLTYNKDGDEDGGEDSGEGGDGDGDASLTKADDKVMMRRVWSLPVGRGSPSTPIAMYENMGQREKWRLDYTSE